MEPIQRFLKHLAEKKYYFYTYFSKHPNANSIEECTERMLQQVRHEELLETISWLPKEQQQIVEARFDKLKKFDEEN